MNMQFPLILDGATGTELQKLGLPAGVSTEQWVLEHPETIIQVQHDYIKNGSNVIYTPTFGANGPNLKAHGICEDNAVHDYNYKLAKLSIQAAEGKALVAGDIGPTGKLIYPMGDFTMQDFIDTFRIQAEALEEAGVDLFVIETMMSLSEIRAALLAVKSVSRKPVLVSMTCNENGKTMMGTDMAAALVTLQGMGADLFGLNCSVGPKEFYNQIIRLHRYAEIPLAVKPNAGLPEIVDGKTVYNVPAEGFANQFAEMAKFGAVAFGGCCGTDPTYIREIAKSLEGVVPSEPAPVFTGLLPCSTGKSVCYLQPDVMIPEPVECDDDLEDAILDANDSDELLMAIAVRTASDLDIFRECIQMLNKPLCICCDDIDLLDEALKAYDGRALYDGNLNDEQLADAVRKYGLVI